MAMQGGYESAKIILQEELISPTGRAIDLNNLLDIDYGRGTIAIIHEALHTRRIDANQMMLAVLASGNGKYYGQVLGMALRAGASPNYYVELGGYQYHCFLYALQNVKNPVYIRDYYLMMVVKGMKIDNPIIRTNSPQVNLNGKVISSKTTIRQYTAALNLGDPRRLDPVTSSRIGIFTGTKSMMIKGYYTTNDVVANHLPDSFTPPDVMKAWVSMNLYAGIVYMNYRVFKGALSRMPEVPYPVANDIILHMYKIKQNNRYLMNIYYQMLSDLSGRGYKLDIWQRRMLMRVSEQSTPACANIAEQFPVDFSMLTAKLNEPELRTMNNICDYANESEAAEGHCSEAGSIPYRHNGRLFCFKPSQFNELLRTGINPEDGSPLRQSFLIRLRNQLGTSMPNTDPNINEFIYRSGVTLDDKSPQQLETIVREIFGTGNLRQLEPEHARVTAAWIGNWAYTHDPQKYNLYIQRLGARPPAEARLSSPVIEEEFERTVPPPRTTAVPRTTRVRFNQPTARIPPEII